MSDQTDAPDSPDSGRLVAECRRLVDRLSGTNPGWYRAQAGGQTRAQRLRELVVLLAELGREAGSGVPDGAVPHDVGSHAIADQVAVLVEDILLAPGANHVVPAAAAAVGRCYDELWPPLRP